MRVCPITHETNECLYSYLPLVLINCYGDSTPVEGEIVDGEDIITSMMHYDVSRRLKFWT